MKATDLIALALSIAVPLCNALPSGVSNAERQDVSLKSLFNSTGTLDDLAITREGFILATTSESPDILVLDPTGTEVKGLSPLVIPDVQAVFAISAYTASEPDSLFYLLADNVTSNGVSAPGSVGVYSINMRLQSDGGYYPQIQTELHAFPGPAVQPTGSVYAFGGYIWVTDVGTNSIISYESATESFDFSMFNSSSSLLENPAGCKHVSGVNHIELGNNNLQLYFSNQAQALTGSIQLEYEDLTTLQTRGDYQRLAGTYAVSSPAQMCSEVTWGRFALDGDNNQWVCTSPDIIVKVEKDGSHNSAVQGVRGPSSVAFGRKSGDENSLYIVAGSQVLVFDTSASTTDSKTV